MTNDSGILYVLISHVSALPPLNITYEGYHFFCFLMYIQNWIIYNFIANLCNGFRESRIGGEGGGGSKLNINSLLIFVQATFYLDKSYGEIILRGNYF